MPAFETGENTFTGNGLAYTWGDWPGFGALNDFALEGTINERDSMAATWSMTSGNAGCFKAGYDTDTIIAAIRRRLLDFDR